MPSTAPPKTSSGPFSTPHSWPIGSSRAPTGELADRVFILTDRKALGTNIREDIEKVNVRLYRSGAGGR